MSLLGFVSTKCYSLLRQQSLNILKRTFLSEAYQCREAWEKRLESPLLKAVNLRTLYQEIDWQFSHFGRANALDVDMYLNANTKQIFIEDIEDVLFKLRLSPDTVNMPPSSHHAAVRVLLDARERELLLKVISNRLKYGIYPDHYCLNLLMDTFLKEGQYTAAARIAVSLMLQEDWESLLTTRLAVYSCHMHLRNPGQKWYYDDEIVPPLPEPKETVKVRVKYISIPFFDDHFDLEDPNLLVGKTLSMFSSKIGGNQQLACSYGLLGLTLHQKWDKVLDVATSLISQKKPVHREVLQLAQKSLEVESKAEEATEPAKVSKPVNPDPKKEEALKAELEKKQRVCETLSSLEPFAISNDLLDEMSLLVKEAVKQQEMKDIKEQEMLYIKWEEERMASLKKYQDEVRKEEALKRIEQQKLELIEKEKEIFFFENEDKLDIMIESQDTEGDKTVVDKPLTKEAKLVKDAEYVPPEVFKRIQ